MAVEQMQDIQSQPTQKKRSEKSTEVGLRDTRNSLLSLHADLFKSTPVEVLHTILLGPCKYFLKSVMSQLSSEQKQQVLARVSAFSMSGFTVKMHGNVCRHYQSFVGRDYKAWSQMAIFVLQPYLSPGQCAVMLSLSKVFCLAYCCHFDPKQADQLQQICQEFVNNCMTHMPELSYKQKTHHLLHLINNMVDYGPSSAFSAERCESFNSMVRLQNIFGNKRAPSRDIANHFAHVNHIRFICEGGPFNKNEQCGRGLQDLYDSKAVQHFFNCTPMHTLNKSKTIHQPGKGFIRTAV